MLTVSFFFFIFVRILGSLMSPGRWSPAPKCFGGATVDPAFKQNWIDRVWAGAKAALSSDQRAVGDRSSVSSSETLTDIGPKLAAFLAKLKLRKENPIQQAHTILWEQKKELRERDLVHLRTNYDSEFHQLLPTEADIARFWEPFDQFKLDGELIIHGRNGGLCPTAQLFVDRYRKIIGDAVAKKKRGEEMVYFLIV